MDQERIDNIRNEYKSGYEYSMNMFDKSIFYICGVSLLFALFNVCFNINLNYYETFLFKIVIATFGTGLFLSTFNHWSSALLFYRMIWKCVNTPENLDVPKIHAKSITILNAVQVGVLFIGLGSLIATIF